VPYLTNENVFGLTGLPASLAILGGGPVGCELAQALARLSSQVTLIEAAPRLLPAANPDAAEVISEVFAAEGITIRTGFPVETVASIPNGGGFLLRLHDSAEVTAERLLVAAGRTPATAGLTVSAPPHAAGRMIPAPVETAGHGLRDGPARWPGFRAWPPGNGIPRA
jgi:pyruvate/2-oxoglutarate dehydrogenase complex dihydrolipoamide dehydrogenase (E3) component